MWEKYGNDSPGILSCDHLNEFSSLVRSKGAICFWGFHNCIWSLSSIFRRYSTKFNTGRLGAEVQPVTLLYIIFDRKGPPFVYLLLTVGTPFRNLVTKVAPLLTYVNALPLKYENNAKPGNFLDFLSALNSSVSPLRYFYRRKGKITVPICIP